MLEITTSPNAAAARGLSARRIWCSAADLIARASLSQATTSQPVSVSRAWIARPMRPSPTSPIFMTACPLYSGLSAVMRGLDPRIHDEVQLEKPYDLYLSILTMDCRGKPRNEIGKESCRGRE